MTTSFADYVKEVEATLSDEEREMLDVFLTYYSTLRERLAASEERYKADLGHLGELQAENELLREALEKITEHTPSYPAESRSLVSYWFTAFDVVRATAHQALAQSERKAT